MKIDTAGIKVNMISMMVKNQLEGSKLATLSSDHRRAAEVLRQTADVIERLGAAIEAALTEPTK
jgi:hypothetical protein